MIVDVANVIVSHPLDGAVKVFGKPGAIQLNGYKATTITITIVREPLETPTPTPAAAFQLLHLAGGLPIGSTYATLAPDGSFTETWIGDSGRPVMTQDEVNLTPQNGVAQAGYTALLRVP